MADLAPPGNGHDPSDPADLTVPLPQQPSRSYDLYSSSASPPLPSVPSLAQSIHCFRTADLERVPRSRARFTDEEREKVLSVRRQGACLRCRILKIQCSLDNPCQPCLQSAVKGSERKVLSFCYCVRTRFADVNIFESSSSSPSSSTSFSDATATMRTDKLMQTMSGLLSRIATPANFTLTSNPTAFNNTMVSWLTDPEFYLPNGSIVALCCSSLLGLQFQDETASPGTDGLITDFRRFLLATSLTHAGWRDGGNSIKAHDLYAAGHLSGCQLLKRLDRILTPQFLARCDRESCQVLFLLVLGTVLGVGYSSSLLEHHSPQFPSAELLSPEFQRSPTLWLAMKEHLCQMLAHHLIFVGSMLGIKLETGVEKRIIDTAVSRWNKAEEFVWADVMANPLEQPTSTAGLSGVVKSEQQDVPELGASSSRSGPSSSSSSPAQHPRPPRLVAIPCPEELSRFQAQVTDSWSENPTSYYSMVDEPENYEPAGQPGDTQRAATPRSSPELAAQPRSPQIQESQQQPPQRKEVKRRSIWIVRPFDGGPDQGLTNVHARLRAGMGMETLRAFV